MRAKEKGMADATTETQAQEATTTSNESASSRSIDEFSPEAQDYIKRLRQENAGHRTKNSELANQLKEYEDRNKTDQQKLEERAATAEGRATAAESQLLRYKVAADNGIPLNLADRLRGTTEDELKADAEKLAQDFGLAAGGSAAAPGGFDGGPRRPVKTAPKSMNELIAQRAGSI